MLVSGYLRCLRPDHCEILREGGPLDQRSWKISKLWLPWQLLSWQPKNLLKSHKMPKRQLNSNRKCIGSEENCCKVYIFWKILVLSFKWYVICNLAMKQKNFLIFWNILVKFARPSQIGLLQHICGWLMAIPWCVTLSGCRGRLLRYSNHFLYGDIGLLHVHCSLFWCCNHRYDR